MSEEELRHFALEIVTSILEAEEVGTSDEWYFVECVVSLAKNYGSSIKE